MKLYAAWGLQAFGAIICTFIGGIGGDVGQLAVLLGSILFFSSLIPLTMYMDDLPKIPQSKKKITQRKLNSV